MPDFSELDPDTRCFALVGRFLQAWSEMEKSLHNAIGAALQIEEKKLWILAANLGSVGIHREFITAAARWIMEAKL